MKLAAVSDDGRTISQHFGRAKLYVVITIEDGVVTGTETRDKLGHTHFSGGMSASYRHGPHHHVGSGSASEVHGQGHGSHEKHQQMATAISDCTILLAGGMGASAYHSLMSLSIQPIITDVYNIEEAVQLYLAGTIVHHIERLH